MCLTQKEKSFLNILYRQLFDGIVVMLNYREIEEVMQEQGIVVDHAAFKRYLNNIIEQANRPIKKLTPLNKGLKSFLASTTLKGVDQKRTVEMYGI
jgi:transposase-like protein